LIRCFHAFADWSSLAFQLAHVSPPCKILSDPTAATSVRSCGSKLCGCESVKVSKGMESGEGSVVTQTLPSNSEVRWDGTPDARAILYNSV